MQNANETKFRIDKVIKIKKCYVTRKGYDNSLNSWIDKKISLYKMSYSAEPHSHSKKI